MHFIPPKSNAHYWRPKIEGNMRRDSETTQQLRDEGWTVLRFWEHEDSQLVAEAIIETWQSSR